MARMDERSIEFNNEMMRLEKRAKELFAFACNSNSSWAKNQWMEIQKEIKNLQEKIYKERQ